MPITEEEIMRQLNKFIKGKTQEKAAKALGISPAYLSDILQGKRSVVGPTILKRFGYQKQIVITKLPKKSS